MYFTAMFASVLIILGLAGLGWAEQKFIPRSRMLTFRLTTANLEDTMKLATESLSEIHVVMQNFQVFRIGTDFVMEFDTDLLPAQQQLLLQRFTPVCSKCEAVPHETVRD
jgi:hypothetical protein